MKAARCPEEPDRIAVPPPVLLLLLVRPIPRRHHLGGQEPAESVPCILSHPRFDTHPFIPALLIAVTPLLLLVIRTSLVLDLGNSRVRQALGEAEPGRKAIAFERVEDTVLEEDRKQRA